MRPARAVRTISAFLAAAATLMTAMATPLQDIAFQTMDGREASLKDYAGKSVLVVNTASKCGLTPQYDALEALYKKYEGKGFVILGFPCNDFKEQEPGTNEEIVTFCKARFGVTFPLFTKIHVLGSEQAPLYKALTGPEAKFPGEVKWNFTKFLISPQGEVLARFEPKTKPDDPAVVAAIEQSLPQP